MSFRCHGGGYLRSPSPRVPLFIQEADGEQPPGVYTVDTEEELLESVSFPAYRRVSTVMRCPAPGGITRA